MMQSADAISGGPDDGRLLAVWRSDQNAEAFAQVVRRHAPMVFGVCRSILGDGPDAHDATQAVFLALVRKAGSLEHHPTLAGWLHRVACYVSIQARRAAAVRRRHEREAARMKSTDTAGSPDLPADLLHEAIGALPDKYRVPIVLHHLEGRSEEETASLLGCSLGTLSSRLSRGRQKLRQRLAQQGAGVTAGVMAAALTQSASAAAEPLPAALLTSLIHMPLGVLAGRASAAVASASAVALSKGAIHMMFMAKLKLAAMVTATMLLIGAAGVGALLLAAAPQAGQPGGQPPAQPTPLAEAKTAAPVDAATEAVIKSGGRYGGFTAKAAQGPHMNPVFATHFGDKGTEIFIGGGELADGTIVAIGNAWGPEFPNRVPVAVLGKGTHSGAAATQTIQDRPRKGQKDAPPPRTVLNEGSPDTTAFMVFYAPGDSDKYAAKSAVRFDWGVGKVSVAQPASDGKSIVLAGVCGPNFNTLEGKVKILRAGEMAEQASPTPATNATKPNKKSPRPVDPSKLVNIFLMRCDARGNPEWAVVIDKASNVPDRFFLDDAQNVYIDAAGLRRISADGRNITLINPRSGGGQARWLGVDPVERKFIFGGDRNTNTGAEPYRQPYAYVYNDKGEITQKLWEPVPREVGAHGAGLQSDSSLRVWAGAKNGDWIFSAWSDGGNSVMAAQPLNWRQPIPGKGMGMDSSGVNASSLTHMVRIDSKTYQAKAYTLWVSYVPNFFGEADDNRAKRMRGKPNGAGIKQILVLENDAVAIAGGAATGLIQTPNAFWKDPLLPDKHGTDNVSVFRPDMSNLMFSSGLPGVHHTWIAPMKNGLLITGSSAGSDQWVKPTATPSVNADQEFAGGLDGWLCVLRFPKQPRD